MKISERIIGKLNVTYICYINRGGGECVRIIAHNIIYNINIIYYIMNIFFREKVTGRVSLLCNRYMLHCTFLHFGI